MKIKKGKILTCKHLIHNNPGKEEKKQCREPTCNQSVTCDFKLLEGCSAKVKQSSQKQEIKQFPAASLYLFIIHFSAAHTQHGIAAAHQRVRTFSVTEGNI